MTGDEGGETGERKQDGYCSQKRSGSGSEGGGLKTEGKGWKVMLFHGGPRGAAAFSLTRMIKRCCRHLTYDLFIANISCS